MTKFKILFSFIQFKELGLPGIYAEKLIEDWNKKAKNSKKYEPLTGNIYDVLVVEFIDGQTIKERKMVFEGSFSGKSFSQYYNDKVSTSLAFIRWCEGRNKDIKVELVES
jgi:hypothetical protein